MAAVTKRNIYLAGFMGTGKSTVGRELARLMGRKFIDTDQALEKLLGMTVNETFAQKGEEFFRTEERKLALELADTFNRVVATGGGTLLDPEVRMAFAKSGLMICLFTTEDQLVQRLERTDKRPMLKGGELRDRVEQLLQERKEIYDKISIRVDTTNLTPQEAARKIHDLLKMRQRVLDRLQSQYIEIS
ncbi:MAG: shikimate kinase [Armatimonadetes bacterium]|nr:shikimate kinase [Armatimonadota bacterium]